MRRFRQPAGRAARARSARKTVGGWFALAVAVTVTQAVGAVPVVAHQTPVAQRTPAPSAVVPGTALAWGSNFFGQLGDGTNADSVAPVSVSLPAGVSVTAVAAGNRHSLALTSAGAVLAWGGNAAGQLGDGTTMDSSTPVSVSLPAGVTVIAIAAGGTHSLALTDEGTVLAWGGNSFGQLGDGTNAHRSTPVSVSLPPGVTVTAVTGGSFHSLAVTAAGAVLAWGDNIFGQLGDGTTSNRSAPVPVGLPAGVTATTVTGGHFHSMAVTSVGAVLAWGNNNFGQLGDGTTTHRGTPGAVSLPAGATVTAITAGSFHSMAVTSVGAVLAWGNNTFGQLGDGTITNRSTPVAVSLPPGTTVVAVAAHDGNHNVALTSAAAALAWGDNPHGQLGNGTTTDSSTPVPVSLPAGATVTAVAAGLQHSLAVVALPPLSTTTLRVTPRSPTADQQVTLTATVTCNTDTPAGTVTFRDNTTVLAATPLTADGIASHTTTLTPGEHSLTADYVSTNTCPESRSVPVAITIDTAPDDPDLPITGPNLPTIVGAAALCILAGAALIRLTGQRRPTSRHLR
ncbi:RCC1 domain-containing protein [Salinispora fenicalii]|uniref:RCC1 domain-containing protein n=1 Tax=Salinispora fenicalii TaxID=1137263 RepID=UPI0004843FF3|nr:Ig-like domain repeat protein [Salinispora fenicalii]